MHTDPRADGPMTLAAAHRERFTAFLADEASEAAVRQCLTDIALPQSSVHRGDITTAIKHLEHTRSPRALMVDITGAEPAVSKVQHLAEVCEPGVAVAVIGDRNDVALYRDLLEIGVTDYLVKPLPRAVVFRAMEKILGVQHSGGTPLSHKLGKVVAVVGTRGGVGATTIACNLAYSLANKRHRRVALVDLDLRFGTCGLMLDAKTEGGLRDALERPQRMDELFLERAMVPLGERLFLLAGDFNNEKPIEIEPTALTKLIGLLRKEFHFVVIDLPRGDDPLLTQTLEFAMTRVLVIDQTTQSIRDAIRLKGALEPGPEGHRNMVVLNRVGEAGKDGMSNKDIAQAIGRPIDASIPFHAKTVVASTNAGVPLLAGRSPAALALMNLADDIGGSLPPPKTQWWRPKFLLNKT